MKYLTLCIASCLLVLTVQIPPYVWAYQPKQAEPEIPFKCMLASRMVPYQDDDLDHYYLCVPKLYLWLLNYIVITEENDDLKLTVKATDEVIQKLKSSGGQLYFVEAQTQQKQDIQLHFLQVVPDQMKGTIDIVHTAMPPQFELVRQEVLHLIRQEIRHEQQHQGGSMFKSIIIQLLLLACCVGGICYWRKKQMESTVDKQPADLKEMMMSKIQLQEEEKKKISGVVRKSQPSRLT